MQKTNLKLAPYFDDFDSSKNYQKILFKPGFPVQARELTQLQTQLQNQIESFANHTFKDGSVVIPGQVGYDLEYHAVLVQNLINGLEVDSYRDSLVGVKVKGLTSEVEGEIVNTLSVTESEKSALTFYVKYTKSGLNTSGVQQTRFANNEVLVNVETGDPVAVTYLQNASAYTGSVAYITNGIYYIRGFFVEVESQTLILDQYSNKPTYKIGLTVTEKRITSDEDDTLFDNANGSTNFAAPGADRLQIFTTLAKELTSFSDNGDFIELMRLNEGEIEEIVQNSVYNELEKNLARRTYDESGDYTVKDFNIKVYEALDNGENNGKFSVNTVLEDGRTVLNRDPISTDPENSINGNNYYAIEVSPGKAYVRGFEIDNVAKRYVVVEKPRSSQSVNNKATNIDFGQYLTLSSVTGSVTNGEELNLRNSSNVNIGKARAIGLISGRLYLQELTTYTKFSINSVNFSVSDGDFVFSSRGSRGVVNEVTTTSSSTTITLRQVTGKFAAGDVISNSRNDVTSTILSSGFTDYTVSNVDNIITSSGFSADVTTSPTLLGRNANFFVTASELPVKEVSDFSYTKLDKVSRVVSNNEVSISAPNNYTPLVDGYYITSSSGVHTATASIVGNTLVLSSITPSLVNNSIVDIFYKLRVNNTSLKEKKAKKFTFLSIPNPKNNQFTVYGNRFNDEEICLKFPDVYKIHRIHEAILPGVADNSMFDRVVVNDTNGMVTGDIIGQNNIKAKIISISGVVLHIVYLSDQKFVDGQNLTTQIVVLTNPNLVGRFLTEVTNGQYKDITNNFALIKNDIEDSYRISKLKRLQNRPSPLNKVTVVFDYFEHDVTNNDFFTASSFDTTEISYDQIPYTYNGLNYADIFDFRSTYQPVISSGLGEVTSPYVCSNPKSAFDIYSQGRSSTQFPYPNEFIGFDYSYFLGRIDRLYLDKSGLFKVSIGSPAVSPAIPPAISNALLISTLNLPAYLRDVKTIKTTAEKTRRYTMKDIGSLESRIDNIEYYTTLSLLETDTNNMNILDQNGNNRFKNGFLVDNFKSRNYANTNDVDFKVSIDSDKGLIRPYPYLNNVGLDYDATAGFVGGLQLTGDFLTLPYDEVEFASNPFASKVVNLNPFDVITWVGDFKITPDRDVWYDTVRSAPDNVPVIDLTGPIQFLYDFTGADGAQWGNWFTTGSGRTGGGTNIFQQRDGAFNEFSSLQQNIEVGDRINNLESITFARSVVIDAFSTKMKPNTELYFFIDGVDSNSAIYPKLFRNVVRTVNSTPFVVGERVRIESVSSRSSRPLIARVISPNLYDETLSASYSSSTTVLAVNDISVSDGTILNPSNPGNNIRFTGLTSGAIAEVNLSTPRIKSNSVGDVHAFVVLPQNSVETGISRFVLTDQTTNTTISGISDTNSVAQYDSNGTLFDITSLSIDLNLPVITSTPISETRTLFIPDPPPPPPPPRGGGGDPIAQSFLIDVEGGIMVSSIDVYFQSKDNSIPVSIDIRTIELGQVTQNIVPYSIKTIPASSVNVSNDASLPTRFTFDAPIFLPEGNEYAFVLRTRSTKYKVWVSRLSETDVSTNQVINKQPYLGSLYMSQNMSVWISVQEEDIKFNINRANFDTSQTYTATLFNKNISSIGLPTDAFYMQGDSTNITVLHPNHCMHTVQNYVDISGVRAQEPTVKLVTNMNNSQFTVNTTLTLSDGSFVPTKINNANISDTNYGYLLIDDEIVAYQQVSGNSVIVPSGGRGLFNTTIVSHNTNSVVEIYSINGIPLTQINTRHRLSNVIDMDRYVITVTSKANTTLQSGGSQALASRNFQYESLSPKLNELVFAGTTLSARVQTVSGSSVSEKGTGTFSQRPEIALSNLEVNELDSSCVVLSTPNQEEYFGSDPSFKLYVDMSSSSSNLSPLFNISGSSVITAMNRINRITNLDGTIDTTSDLQSSGSLHDAVYVTKKVTLENSSTAVKVMFDAVRKQGVDIKVFVKFKRIDEVDDFNLLDYQEVPSTNYPFSPDLNTYRGFEFELESLPEFKEYAIKLVMIGDDQSNVPKIRNFRGIALAV